MKGQNMTVGTPWKVLLRFALPLMAASMLQQLYNTVDTIIVGNLDSQTSLAVVGSCAYLTMMYVAVASGLSMGAGVLIAQAFGAKNEENMRKAAGTAVVMMSGLGIAIMLISLAASEFFLRSLVAVPESVLPSALIYIRVYSLGMIFQFGYNVAASTLRAVGDSKSSLYFLAVSSVMNIGLDLLFVGAFHWGVFGVALATVLSQLVSMVVSFVYMFRKYPMFRPSRVYWRWNGGLALQIFKTGIPMTIQSVITACGFMLLQRLVNAYGEALTASYTVACKLEIYMLVPISSINSAMSVYAGQNWGAKEMRRIRSGVRQSVGITLVLAVLVGVPCFLLAEPMVKLFGLEGQSVAYSAAQVCVVAFDLLLFALYQPLSGLYQGVGKGFLSTIMSGIELSGRVIFAYLLSGVMGPAGVWWGEPFAWLAVILFAYICFFTGVWKKEKSVKKLPAQD